MLKTRNVASRVALALLLTFAAACSGYAGQAAVGVRAWYANWSVDRRSSSSLPEDLGETLMYVGQLSYSLANIPLSVSVQYGTGDGWEGEHDRSDLLVAAAYKVSVFHGGLGYHSMHQSSHGYENVQHGLELLGGGAVRLGHGFHVGFMAGFIPILSWDAEEEGIKDDGGHIAMYTYDVNMAYTFERFRVAVGYRAQHIEGGEGESGYSWVSPDDFSGIYGSGVVSF